MMIIPEYKILSYIHSKGDKCSIEYYDTLSDVEQVVFKDLYKKGYIGYSDCVPDGIGGYKDCKSFFLTKKGILALLAEDERLDEIDKQAADDAYNKSKSHTLSIYKMAMNFIVSLVSGKFAKIVEWIKSMIF